MPGADRPARRVDVEVDVLGRVLGGQQQDLRAQPVGDVVVDLRPQEDDALGEQALIDGVDEVETLTRSNACQSRLVTCFLHCFSPTLTNPRRRALPEDGRVRSERHFAVGRSVVVVGSSSASCSSASSASRRNVCAAAASTWAAIGGRGFGRVGGRGRTEELGGVDDVAVGVGDGGRRDDRGDGQAAAHVGEHRPAAGCSPEGTGAAAAARCRTAATSAPAAR